MEIIREITIDVSKYNSFNAIIAKQLDCNSRFLKVKLQSNGLDILVEDDCTVVLTVLRSDEQANAFNCSTNLDGTVTVPLTNWVLAKEGLCKCEISIYKNDSRLTTTIFELYVEQTITVDEAQLDSDDIDMLSSLIIQCTSLKSDYNDALDDIEEFQTSIQDFQTSLEDEESQLNSTISTAQTVSNELSSINTLSQNSLNALVSLNAEAGTNYNLLSSASQEGQELKENLTTLKEHLETLLSAINGNDITPLEHRFANAFKKHIEGELDLNSYVLENITYPKLTIHAQTIIDENTGNFIPTNLSSLVTSNKNFATNSQQANTNINISNLNNSLHIGTIYTPFLKCNDYLTIQFDYKQMGFIPLDATVCHFSLIMSHFINGEYVDELKEEIDFLGDISDTYYFNFPYNNMLNQSEHTKIMLVFDNVSSGVFSFNNLSCFSDNGYETYTPHILTNYPFEQNFVGYSMPLIGDDRPTDYQYKIYPDYFLADSYDVISGKITKRIGIVENYDSQDVGETYFTTTGALTQGSTVLYKLDEPIITYVTPIEVIQQACIMVDNGYLDVDCINDINAVLSMFF